MFLLARERIYGQLRNVGDGCAEYFQEHPSSARSLRPVKVSAGRPLSWSADVVLTRPRLVDDAVIGR